MIMFFLQLSLLFFCNYDIILLKSIFFLRIASAKSNFHGQLLDYWSHVLALVYEMSLVLVFYGPL